MRGSLIIISFFIVGCLVGQIEDITSILSSVPLEKYALYALLLLVGISIGSNRRIKELLLNIHPRMLLIPVATWVGTLMSAAIVALFFTRWSLFENMAIGSGFAYYSLSSILITDIKTPMIGVKLATELGAIALIANITREVITLTATPLLVRYFGPLAPICAGGATTMDTTLPIITQYAGKEYAFVAIFHGIIIDLSVPLLVTLFCSLG